jgi:hypothetical protein
MSYLLVLYIHYAVFRSSECLIKIAYTCTCMHCVCSLYSIFVMQLFYSELAARSRLAIGVYSQDFLLGGGGGSCELSALTIVYLDIKVRGVRSVLIACLQVTSQFFCTCD